jgi:two-component system, chemotaxis family, chemotaxis protein CheY
MALRVLIIDDSPAIRGYVKKQLLSSGLGVAETFDAPNGQEALSMLDQHHSAASPINLIFCDVNMPVMNGEAFLKEKSLRPIVRCIPVIMFTSDATQARVFRMKELGAKAYLSKPCDPVNMRAKIEQVLADEVRGGAY